MNSDVGVLITRTCALVLIDREKEMFEVIPSQTSADLIERNDTAAGQDRQGIRDADRALDRWGSATASTGRCLPRFCPSWMALARSIGRR